MTKNGMIIEERIIAALMCFMAVLVVMQVASRYVLHGSLSYTEELVRYCFVWATFLGASAAVAKGRHLSIAGALTFMPKKYSGMLAGIGGAAFTGIAVFYGFKVVALQIRTGQTTAAMGLPMWPFGLAIPLCGLCIIARIVQKTAGSSGKAADEPPAG